jgi:hypothetical protein
MRELKRATFKEICIAIATSTFHEVVRIWLANVSGHADVATQEQNISTICVLNVQVTKFKM